MTHFTIPYMRYLTEVGVLEKGSVLPIFAQDSAQLIALYQMMVKVRQFDKKAVALQRTGQLSTFPPATGQEAIPVGIGAAMRPEDVFCPYYRDHGALFWRGVTMEEVLLYWGGEEAGSCYQKSVEDFPVCVPIASQTLHAVGVATAFKIRKQPRVAVTTIGDGGTSRGDFYEAMNVAGAWNLPVVFVINNNQWAISVPLKQQTHAATLAQKAIAAGLPGVQIDGNDVIAVKHVIGEAIEKARTGGGATVIEALTYRLCDHTTADDATRYQPPEEVALHKTHDPILRLRTYIHAQGWWDEEKEKHLYKTIQEDIQRAVDNYLAHPIEKPASMFTYLYETLPSSLQSQYDDLAKRG